VLPEPLTTEATVPTIVTTQVSVALPAVIEIASDVEFHTAVTLLAKVVSLRAVEMLATVVEPAALAAAIALASRAIDFAVEEATLEAAPCCTLANVGIARAARIPKITRTTINSRSVKAFFERFTIIYFLCLEASGGSPIIFLGS